MSLGNYLLDKILGDTYGGVPFAPASPLYLHLYTSNPGVDDSGTETSYGNYVKQSISFGAVAANVIANNAAINFPAASATGTPVTITHAAIKDGSGNLYNFVQLPTSRVVNEGTEIVVDASDLTITRS